MEKTPGNDNNENIFKSVRSHLLRVKEGRQLLKEGRSLSEMTTPIEGPSNEYLQLKRQEFINGLHGMDKDALDKLLQDTDEHILKIRERNVAGESELLWQRTVILDILGEI